MDDIASWYRRRPAERTRRFGIVDLQSLWSGFRIWSSAVLMPGWVTFTWHGMHLRMHLWPLIGICEVSIILRLLLVGLSVLSWDGVTG